MAVVVILILRSCLKEISNYCFKLLRTKGSPKTWYANSLVYFRASSLIFSNSSSFILKLGSVGGGQKLHLRLHILVISTCIFLNFLISNLLFMINAIIADF